MTPDFSLRIPQLKVVSHRSARLKRSTFYDAMEKRDHRVFEDVFHAVADKAWMTAGKTEKQFKNPLCLIDAPVISLCLAYVRTNRSRLKSFPLSSFRRACYN
jgi:hypothetical protein